MVVVDILNISREQYQNLINYILDSTDEASFHLPGIYDNGKPLMEEYWQEYHKKNADFLQKCFSHGARQSNTKHYQKMKLGQYSKVIIVKPFPLLCEMLLEYHLFDWVTQNQLPEDVCFFEKNNIRFFTCSHEQDFCIYNETKNDLTFLKDKGFVFWKR